MPILVLCAAAGDWAAFNPVHHLQTVVQIALLLLLVPSLTEELFFRAILLPAACEVRGTVGIVAAIALFVAWHPLQAVTFGPPWADLFLDPWFFTAVTALSIALARIYLATGSLWPSVLTHWIVVATWKLVFDGPFGPTV